MKQQSIVYVSYSPYENQGNILNYVIENFEKVYLFSIGHHSLGKNKKTNTLTIYKNKRIVHNINLRHLFIPSNLVFLLLPIRSVLNIVQILSQVYKIKTKVGKKIDVYFSVNGFAAWVGLILRSLRLVDKTIYWVCDYYPIIHKDKVIQTMRWLYAQFEKYTTSSDRLAFHNIRLVNVWQKRGLIGKSDKYPLIPLGTDYLKVNRKSSAGIVRLGFLGVVKKSQGLDFLFDSADYLTKSLKNIEVSVIGSGPDEDYFKKRAKETGLKVKFHGYIGEKQIDLVLSRCTLGVALYVPDPSNVSYFGDPTKIKRYISLGMPTIATGIHEFSKELENSGAGINVKYGDCKSLVDAIKKIMANYKKYQSNALKLRKKYYYKSIYPAMFEL